MTRTESPISTQAPQTMSSIDNDQNTLAAVSTALGEERDLVNQILGQHQMATAFQQLAQTISTSKLVYVKERKLYKSLAGKRLPDGQEMRGTWAEFCELLGISPDKADMDIANLRTFGEQALESMTQMGVGYRELRQFRRLPEDQREALIEVAQTGDKEAFVELAEEILAKSSREKEALTRERDDARADYEAQGEVLARKSQELAATQQELEKVRRRVAAMPPSEAVQELRTEITAIALEAEVAMAQRLRAGFAALREQASGLGSVYDHASLRYMSAVVSTLEAQLAAIREDFALPDDSGAQWMDPAAVEALNAKYGTGS